MDKNIWSKILGYENTEGSQNNSHDFASTITTILISFHEKRLGRLKAVECKGFFRSEKVQLLSPQRDLMASYPAANLHYFYEHPLPSK